MFYACWNWGKGIYYLSFPLLCLFTCIFRWLLHWVFRKRSCLTLLERLLDCWLTAWTPVLSLEKRGHSLSVCNLQYDNLYIIIASNQEVASENKKVRNLFDGVVGQKEMQSGFFFSYFFTLLCYGENFHLLPSLFLRCDVKSDLNWNSFKKPFGIPEPRE